MSDTTLNLFDSNGPTAARVAFVPNPPTVATGADCGYLWWDTDLQALFAYDFGLADWVQVGGASGTVTNTGALNANELIIGNGGTDVTALGTLGTTTTVLHGNAGGAPTFGSVSLTADVSGDLPFSSLAQGSALSVLGVTGNATADVASIAAGTDNQVLRRSGTAVAFGAVNLASSDAVTGDLPFANLAQLAGLSVAGVTGSSTADVAAITASADNQVLTRVSSSSLAFAVPAMVKIAENTPSATGTTTFSSLGTFTHLQIVYSARSDVAGTNDVLNMRFNSDSGANYDIERLRVNSTTVAGAETIAGTSAQIGTVAGSTAASGNCGAGEIMVPDYRGTTFHKQGTTTNTFKQSNASANTFVQQYGYAWRNTAAITQIDLILSTGNFVSGSKFTLYGLS